jgi:hypothetical protein
VRFAYERYPGQVFFNEEAVGHSHYGIFPHEGLEVWNDQRVADFVQGGSPQLFKTLQRLPVSSEYCPAPINLQQHFLTPAERVLVEQSTTLTSRETHVSSRHVIPGKNIQHITLYQARTVKLQHKRYLQARVLSTGRMSWVQLYANWYRWSSYAPPLRQQALQSYAVFSAWMFSSNRTWELLRHFVFRYRPPGRTLRIDMPGRDVESSGCVSSQAGHAEVSQCRRSSRRPC